MAYDRDDYYQEAFECAMADEGLWHLVEQMTPEQRANIGGVIAGAVENEGMAFYQPQSPAVSENARLQRKLKWERELRGCDPCKGRGRLEYAAGPWWVNTDCHHCHGAGKVHPLGEREPA